MNLFNLVPAVFRVLQAGQALNNQAAWKQVQNIVNLLAALVAVAAAFGYTIPASSDDLAIVAGGIVALVNIYLTVATTDRIGFGKPKNDIPPIELMGQSQGYNNASQVVESAPATQSERTSVDAAPQNPVVRRPGTGAERGDSASDRVRQPVPAGHQPRRVESVDPNTYPQFGAGFGDRD